MKSVYLSGPITGCTYDGCTDWRKYVAQRLAHDIIGVSPLRGKEYLKTLKAMPHTFEDRAMSSQRGIMTRDRFDTMTCDAVFVNFLGVTWEELSKVVDTGDVTAVRASLGTVMEIAWADMLRKPIILVMEKEGNIHDHPMIREAAGYRVSTLDEGIAPTPYSAWTSLEIINNLVLEDVLMPGRDPHPGVVQQDVVAHVVWVLDSMLKL